MAKPTAWVGANSLDMRVGGPLSILTAAPDSILATKPGRGKLFSCATNASDKHSAADATSHLFFAYLRSMSPEGTKGMKDMIGLPRSLQQLVQATEYPPETPTLMFNETTKVVMIVNAVSPTPYALLRRAKNFEYRDDDSALQQFSNVDDPVRALTDECRRVLKCISSANQSTISTSKASTSLKDASWSRFEDMGFGVNVDESDGEGDNDTSLLGPRRQTTGLKTQARSVNGDFDRPTTPSWADFLSTGFPDDKVGRSASPMLLPPDKVLPPIQLARGQSSQSHRPKLETESTLEPGELASINKIDLDDSFWWVWISSLAGEEPTSRKAVFGRCALIETLIAGGKWMVMEEQVKGAAPEPAAGAYVAEKKGFFRALTTKRGRTSGKKSTLRKGSITSETYDRSEKTASVVSRTNIAPDQQARIHAAAQELQRRHEEQAQAVSNSRRGRTEENQAKTNSVMTLQPAVLSEASQAMKWLNQYDKNEFRSKYLGNDTAGRGSSVDLLAAAKGPQPTTKTPESAPLPAASPPPVAKDEPLPKIPLPASPPREKSPEPVLAEAPKTVPSVPAPVEVATKTPSAQPQESPVLPPSPPASNKVSDPVAAAAPTQVAKFPTRESSKPAEPPTPDSMPSHTTERESSESKEAEGVEAANRLQKRQPGSGIKALFGSRRPREKSNAAKTNAPMETGTAVAAARAALSKKAQPNGASTEHTGKGVETSKGSSEYPSKVQQTASALAAKAAPNKLTKQRSPPVVPAESNFEAAPGPDVPRSPNNRTPTRIPTPPAVAPPREPTPRSTEGENLSRVPTKDREHADREFSTFDQGPLLDQPAFVPGSGSADPVSPVDSDHPSAAPKAAVPSAEAPVQPKEETSDPVADVNPADRWAQIRKNAAERAARQNEEGKTGEGRTSEDSPADGEEQESKSGFLVDAHI